jgi:hypothetical protein
MHVTVLGQPDTGSPGFPSFPQCILPARLVKGERVDIAAQKVSFVLTEIVMNDDTFAPERRLLRSRKAPDDVALAVELYGCKPSGLLVAERVDSDELRFRPGSPRRGDAHGSPAAGSRARGDVPTQAAAATIVRTMGTVSCGFIVSPEASDRCAARQMHLLVRPRPSRPAASTVDATSSSSQHNPADRG